MIEFLERVANDRHLSAGVISAAGLVSIPVIWIIVTIQEKIKKKRLFRKFPIGVNFKGEIKF